MGGVIAIESELTSREGRPGVPAEPAGGAVGSGRAVDDTVTVTAVTDKPVVTVVSRCRRLPRPKTGFLGGLEKGWAAARSFGLWVAAVAGAILPFVPAHRRSACR